MMRKRILIGAMVLSALFCVAAFGGTALSPMLTEITLPPGSSYEDDISLTNTGDDPIVIEVRVRGFTAPDGIPIFTDDYAYSGRDLITITPTEQTIEPGETALFHYRAAMPEDLDPYGGRYAAAIFRVKPADTTAQVVVAAQVASLFLLSPAGEAAPHFRFAPFKPQHDEQNPRLIHCSGLITNDGNLHVNAEQMYGFMHITDEDGFILGQMLWKPHTTLPNNAYIGKRTWLAPDTLPSGTYYLHMTAMIYLPDGAVQRYEVSMPVELRF